MEAGVPMISTWVSTLVWQVNPLRTRARFQDPWWMMWLRTFRRKKEFPQWKPGEKWWCLVVERIRDLEFLRHQFCFFLRGISLAGSREPDFVKFFISCAPYLTLQKPKVLFVAYSSRNDLEQLEHFSRLRVREVVDGIKNQLKSNSEAGKGSS